MTGGTKQKGIVRGGGTMGPRGWLFELNGGLLCFDFTNTVDKRPLEDRRDHLASYADLVSWGEQAGGITAADGRRLRQLAARRPGEGRAALRRARQVREAIFAIFHAVAGGRKLPREDLDTLNAALPGALGRQRLVPARDRMAWDYSDEPENLDRVLFPVVRSAAELLTGDDLDRVRECCSDCCAWLFLDTSRNRTRRWCDMTVCGNRAKARRHYARQKRRPWDGTG